MTGRHERPAPADAWQRVARTILATAVTVAALAPAIVGELGIDPARYPDLAGLLAGLVAICAAVTRVLAIPAVNAVLPDWLRAPAARTTTHDRHTDPAD